MRAAPLVWWFLFLMLNMKKINLSYARFELSHFAYICVHTDGKSTEIGLYKIFFGPFERAVCLGWLSPRQFKTLLSSGFITLSHVRDVGDGYTHSYYVAGGDEK